ncbi:MAG: cysteine peptidase family C39 domain-containing protein [Verrucomicrobia bacterium]|nr:cysteine peptidase family C39 domain-containing protein [Verrucomicrobiota bacterium]
MSSRSVTTAVCLSGCLLSVSPVWAEDAREAVYQALAHLPIEQRLTEAPAFEAPLVPVAPPGAFAVENAQLWAALESLYHFGSRTGIPALEAFLEAYPDSVWMPSLRNHLAVHYERRGRYSLALEHWQAVWTATEAVPAGEARHQADLALARWTRLLCGLGEISRLHGLMPAVRARFSADPELDRTLREIEARYGALLTRPPGVVNCGTLAITRLLGDPRRTEFLLQALALNKAPAQSCSLAQLVEVAQEVKLRGTVVAVAAEGVRVPVPALAHLQVGHFVSVTEERDGRYRVEDPGLQRGFWMEAGDLWAELSGYFLLLERPVPAGYRLVPTEEAAGVVGRGLGSEVDDAGDEGGSCSSTEAGDDPECPPAGCVETETNSQSAGPEQAGISAVRPDGPSIGQPCKSCGPSSREDRTHFGNPGDLMLPGLGFDRPRGGQRKAGMPAWSVSEPFLNLWLTDTPMRYARADGSWQEFTLRYKQRNPRTDPWGWGFGPNWEGNRLTYLDRYVAGSLDVQMYVPGGGRRRYPDPTYYAPADSYEYRTRSRLEYAYDGQGQVNAVRVLWPNGAVSTYGYRYVIWNGPERYFLTQQSDPAGRSTTYTYQLVSNRVHLASVTDRDGLSTSFLYGNGSYPHQVTAITNTTLGLGMALAYNSAGRLTNLVDTAGIASGFTYLANGWVTNLVTPYGTTLFQLSGTSTTFANDAPWAFNRSALITEPDGTSKHLFVYRDGGDPDPDPLGLLPDLDPYGGWPTADWPKKPYAQGGFPDDWWGWTLDGTQWMQMRNTHYWGPHQYAVLNANFRASAGNLSLLTTADFAFARMRHWLHSNDPFGYVNLGLSSTLAMEREPSPDGTLAGQTTWFDHDEKTMTWVEGPFSPRPSLIARVMPDGTVWGQRFLRNAAGQLTELLEYWKSPTDQDRYRTNRFVYATNGVDVVTRYGPGEEFEAGFAYDQAHPHLPVAMTNALGEVTRYYYDSAQNKHRLLGVSHPTGLASTNTYSGAWLQSTREFLGTAPLSTNTFTWLNGYLRTHADSRGLTRTFTRDSLGRLTRVDYSSDSTFETFSYVRPSDSKPILDLTVHRDRLGRTNLYTYTPLRQLESFTDALGRVTRYTYCGCGGPDSVTAAYGTSWAETTSYDYDGAGRPTFTYFPDGTVIERAYDRPGRLVFEADPIGSLTNYFDNLSRLYVAENAAGVLFQTGYDDHDRVLSHTDASGVTVTNAYDALGRLTLRATPTNGGVERWAYTANVAAPTAYTNQVAKITLYAYDAAGRKTNEVQVGVFTNRFTYTAAGDLAALADGRNQTTTWKYDAEGRVTEKWYQGQSTADLLYTYNANGWLTNRFTRTGTGASTNGYVTTYTYDAVGNLTGVDYPAGTTDLAMAYDALNRLTNRVDAAGTTRYSYAMLGSGRRTMSESGLWATDTVTVTNRYGRRAGLTIQQPSSSFIVTNAWDAAGRWNVVGGTAGTFTYAYAAGLASSLPVRLTLPGGGYVTNTYDALARVTRTELRTSGGTIRNAHGYQYNLAHQRTLIGRTNSAVSAWNGYVNALYDPAGQLTNAWTYQPNGTAVLSEKWSYGYDAAQNLSKRTNNTAVETFTVNALNQLTVIPDSAPTYDRRGNLTSRYFTGAPWANWYYTYDHENQLTQVATDTSTTLATNRFRVDFIYDGQGRLRVRKDYVWGAGDWSQSNEMRYLYDGMLIVQERNGSNVPTVTYTRGRDLSGGLSGAGALGVAGPEPRVLGGELGQPQLLPRRRERERDGADGQRGTLQASYKYDPYGRYLSENGGLATTNVMRFSSKPWVGFGGPPPPPPPLTAGCFSDPYLQRWVNRDRMGERGGRNLYVVIRNAPITLVDPFGLQAVRSDEFGCWTRVPELSPEAQNLMLACLWLEEHHPELKVNCSIIMHAPLPFFDGLYVGIVIIDKDGAVDMPTAVLSLAHEFLHQEQGIGAAIWDKVLFGGVWHDEIYTTAADIRAHYIRWRNLQGK